MTNELTIKIDPAEIVQLQQNGKDLMFNPKAETAVARFLEIKREVDDAFEWLKSEIERQALEYNPNFTSLKGDKIKVNYSAAGAKYKGDTKKHDPKFWDKKVTWSINSKACDEHLAKFYKLPTGIDAVDRKKSIRISEVNNDK